MTSIAFFVLGLPISSTPNPDISNPDFGFAIIPPYVVLLDQVKNHWLPNPVSSKILAIISKPGPINSNQNEIVFQKIHALGGWRRSALKSGATNSSAYANYGQHHPK